MPSYTCSDYFLGRLPDLPTIMPLYPVAVAIDAAMALYWDRFVPECSGLWVPSPSIPNKIVAPPLDEALLTDRQKVIVGLRAALGVVPVLSQGFSQSHLIEAKAGPAEAKFEELNKIVRVLLPQWQTELKNLEAFEDIFFDILPNVPAYLERWREFSRFDNNVGYVFASGTWFVQQDLGPNKPSVGGF